MKTESISLDQWRSNLASQQRFANFWSNVSSIKIASTASDAVVRAVAEGSAKVESR